eukprot:TRINITY_DN190486_c0_g1_i1.p1 TRINITY_DN190486_c0_g1~~TRINITY_DN190486_c0_g1_i1.p1  ORF type:complete len:139 (-),score=19.22 TRINITY_DN190486_c0_g1_i1:123-539(-)
MEVAYDCDGSIFHVSKIKYAPQGVVFQLKELLDWWMGRREIEGVPPREKWKCRYCEFLLGCKLTPLDKEEIKAEIDVHQEYAEIDQSDLGVVGEDTKKPLPLPTDDGNRNVGDSSNQSRHVNSPGLKKKKIFNIVNLH